MAIQRTITQKNEEESPARIHLTYVLPKSSLPVREVKSLTTDSKKSDSADSALFGYSALLIYRDIVRTLVVTTITIGILVGIVLSGRV